jgi:flavin-dependent dehydrogenase
MSSAIIAGAGIAAAATAKRLLQLGFRVAILDAGKPIVPGAECIPEPAVDLLGELGLNPAVMAASAVRLQGFENEWSGGRVTRPGTFVHVDRCLLARHAIRLAVFAGAELLPCDQLPRLAMSASHISIEVHGRRRTFDFAVDASGRSAVWSRPVGREGHAVADIFMVPDPEPPKRARVWRWSEGWAYRIGLPGQATVGVIRRQGSAPRSSAEYVGRRPAFPQWAASPVCERRFSVGDAALAHDPISGLGIRFAVASARAASTAMKTSSEAAISYYRSFVDDARRAHLAYLARVYDEAAIPPVVPGIPAAVRFSAELTVRELSVAGEVIHGDVLTLPDGGLTRWAGSFDLLRFKELAPTDTPSAVVLEELRQYLDDSSARALLGWCLAHGVLQGS